MTPNDTTNTILPNDLLDDSDLDAAMEALVDREIAQTAVPSRSGPPPGALMLGVPTSAPSQVGSRLIGDGLQEADAEVVASFEVGDSVELSEHLERDLRGSPPAPLVHAEGAFWRYDPQRGAFEQIPAARPRSIVSGYSRLPVRSGKSARPLSVSQRLVNDAVLACADRLSAAAPDFFRDAVPGIAFCNVFVALDGGALAVRPHSAAHRIRHTLPFDYDPEAPCPRWRQFLSEVFPPLELDDGTRIDDGAQRAAMLQEFLGACLFGQATRYGTTVVLVGEGSNGKSVLQKVVTAPFPTDAVASIAPQRWSKSHFLADLAGKLLNVVSEMPARDISDSDLFKAVVTGDALTADRKYEAAFRFAAQAGHLFACNALPATRDHSEGFWRRFVVLHFNATFTGREDTGLADRLVAEELPGILAWMVEGARRLLLAGRYTIPTSSARAKQAWQADADQVQEFVEECVTTEGLDVRDTRVPTPDESTIGARDLYTIYQYWALRSGHRALSNKEFGKRIKKFLPYKRTERTRIYVGRLTTEGQRFTIPNETPRSLTPPPKANNNIE